MTLSEEAHQRLTDIVELQPTKNAALADRWGMESGSEVHQYLESELGEYYYRNENSLICATPAGETLVGGDTGETALSVSELEKQVLDVLPDVDDDPQSVVATLQGVRALGSDPTVDEVRSTIHTLVDRGLVSRVRRTVPTFRLAVERDSLTLELRESETQ